MSFHRISILVLASSLFSFYADADTIYKTIDENGKVSYSSSPPAGTQTSKKITILPAPSDSDIRAAKQRHEQNLRAEKIYSDSRQQREEKIAEDIRIRQEKDELYTPPPQHHEKTKEEGPYYGIPGRGILVLPKGPRINR